MASRDAIEGFDTSDEIEVAAREAAIRRAKDRELAWFRELLGTYPGRFLIWKQIKDAGVFRLSYAGELTHETSFNEGRRNAGLKLVDWVFTANPSAYTVMQQEASERDRLLETEMREIADGNRE
jgi:hypothetical protein